MLRLLAIILLAGTMGSCQSQRSIIPFPVDQKFFSEPPHIVPTNSNYTVQWRYGEWAFYFFPTRSVVDGSLHLWVNVSTSTGCASGKLGSITIDDADEIRAIETGGAFWVNPDGSKTPMEIRRP